MSTNESVQHISRPITVTLGVNNAQKMDISAPAAATSEVLPSPTKYRPAGTIPNTPFYASFISWSLGGLFWTSLLCGAATLVLREGWIPGVTVETILGNGRWTRCVKPQLGFYLASWALFHVLEFWMTAACNKEKLSVDGE
jgi:protein-S-isoprenylcysteine O-methyltransferase